jgi:hypothetical protein
VTPEEFKRNVQRTLTVIDANKINILLLMFNNTPLSKWIKSFILGFFDDVDDQFRVTAATKGMTETINK